MTISGHTSTLAWTDFLGAVPAQAHHLAFTSTSFNVQTPFVFRMANGQQLDFRLSSVSITVTLNRTQSWAQTTGRTATLLRHEQGHYDITALLMRDLDNALAPLLQQTFATQQALQQAVAAVRDPLVTLHNRLQSTPTVDGTYDRQTSHGATTAVQTQWNNAFQSARASSTTQLRAALQAQGLTVP